MIFKHREIGKERTKKIIDFWNIFCNNEAQYLMSDSSIFKGSSHPYLKVVFGLRKEEEEATLFLHSP
mgnify:CR=1 FL=1